MVGVLLVFNAEHLSIILIMFISEYWLLQCGRLWQLLECSLAAQTADYLQDSEQNTMQKSFAILVPIPGIIVTNQQ